MKVWPLENSILQLRYLISPPERLGEWLVPTSLKLLAKHGDVWKKNYCWWHAKHLASCLVSEALAILFSHMTYLIWSRKLTQHENNSRLCNKKQHISSSTNRKISQNCENMVGISPWLLKSIGQSQKLERYPKQKNSDHYSNGSK